MNITELNTLEKNTLIAKFMGDNFIDQKFLAYHLNWSYLMPVCTRIVANGNYWLAIYPNGCEIGKRGEEANIIDEISSAYPPFSITPNF